MKTVDDVGATLGVSVENLVLDSGYVSAELLGRHHIGTRNTLIARMPARRGYPHRELY